MSAYDGTTPAERDAMQRQTDRRAARQHTSGLRHSSEPRWDRLRQRLQQAGISVKDAAVARKHTEDRRLEFGLVLARDGRAFAFEFDFPRDEEGQQIAYEDARASVWEELDHEGRERLSER